MAVNQNGNVNSIAYGLGNALQGLAPQPIVSKRNPTVNDTAQLGTLWCNSSNDEYFILTSVSGGVSNWQASQTGSGTFASVTVTGGGTALNVAAGNAVIAGTLGVSGTSTFGGNVVVNGTLTANSAINLSSPAAVSIVTTDNVANAITLSTNGGTSESILIEAQQGTSLSSVDIVSLNGGITVGATNSTSNSAILLSAGSGGVNLEAALSSQFTVTGASQNLVLDSVGGAVQITGTQSAPSAVAIAASGAAGTVVVTGTGGVTVSATNNALSLQSGTGNLNIGTSAAANTLTIGNSTGASSVTINAGTGGLNLGTNAVNHIVNIGNTTTGTTVNIKTPTGQPVEIDQGINVGAWIISGTGSPNGSVNALQGSLYLRTDGSSTSTRAYINTNGTNGWTAITTAT